MSVASSFSVLTEVGGDGLEGEGEGDKDKDNGGNHGYKVVDGTLYFVRRTREDAKTHPAPGESLSMFINPSVRRLVFYVCFHGALVALL